MQITHSLTWYKKRRSSFLWNDILSCIPFTFLLPYHISFYPHFHMHVCISMWQYLNPYWIIHTLSSVTWLKCTFCGTFLLKNSQVPHWSLESLCGLILACLLTHCSRGILIRFFNLYKLPGWASLPLCTCRSQLSSSFFHSRHNLRISSDKEAVNS